MIEDKELGLKIAENKEEEIWYRVVKARKETIESLEESLIIEKEFLKTAEKMLKEAKK